MRKAVYVSAERMKENELASERINAQLSGLNKKYFVESYGCQMNEHDAEKLRAMLQNMGYEPASVKQEADFIIFNTCCVRDHAEKRVFGNIGALRKLKELNPDMIIGVCGCMMQQREVSERLYKRFPYVNIIFGTNELHDLPVMVEAALSGERVMRVRELDGEIAEGVPALRAGKFSTCVNIMYGCDNFCTYCIVPYVRGRERSRLPEDIYSEVCKVAEEGFSEVTLLGQNVNSYHAEDGTTFPALLEKLCDIDKIERLRFMTSHPKDLSPELIKVMARQEKVCKHIHLPVQSGSTRILTAMNRRYTRESYLKLVEDIRAAMPEIELTTDVIVGFPGETEEYFAETMSLFELVRFSSAYTFMYSPRKGTRAALMDEQVPDEVKKERLARLNALEAEILQRENKRFVGTSGRVLVEGVDRRGETMAFGKLSNFKMVYFAGSDELIGKLVDVRITDTQNNSLIGELIG